MRLYAAALACFGAGTLPLALADPPASAPQEPAATTAARTEATPSAPVAKATAPASSAASSAAATAPPAKPSLNADEKRLISMGYKPEMLRGEKVYCRSEPVLGSRFVAKHCGTVDMLKDITRDSRDAMEKIQRTQANPMGH